MEISTKIETTLLYMELDVSQGGLIEKIPLNFSLRDLTDFQENVSISEKKRKLRTLFHGSDQ